MSDQNTNKNQVQENATLQEQNDASSKTKKKLTSKQIVAWVGIVLLLLMYVFALFMAIFDKSDSMQYFWTCLYGTIALPILIWIYGWIYDKIKHAGDGQ